VVNALAVVTESASKNMGPQVKEGLKELVDEADTTPGTSDFTVPDWDHN